MPLVTSEGFAPVDPGVTVLDLPNDADPAAVAGRLDGTILIRIPFPSSHDGRGFSLARRLRDLGYRGRLRAKGAVISDQFRYALDCGFDEVEIDDALAARQPEAHWIAEAGAARTYRDKLSRRAPVFPAPKGVYSEQVSEVEHYTDRLFRFSISRPAALRFRSGEFVMIGLANAEKPVFRAYSIASPAWDDTLEFYSIKVPDGPLTQHLQRIQPGDTVLMRRKATGTLVNDALLPGKRLWLFSTGTGIAPFASLIRDPETYARFGQVILTHTCREASELAYGQAVVAAAKADPLVGEEARAQLVHYPTTTRGEGPVRGRITDLLETERLFADLGVPRLDPTTDRVMICGSMEMLKDLKTLCEANGLAEGTGSSPAQFVVERAFVG